MSRLVIVVLIFVLLILTSCSCFMEKPVCGADSKTYYNSCFAWLSGIDSVLGECRPSTECGTCSRNSLTNQT
jgi:hypothetical protein